MLRRMNGDGHITQRKNGTYQINIKYKGVQKSFYGKSEKEVREKLRKFQVDCYNGVKLSTISVSVYIENWLKTVKKDRVKPSSYDRLERTYVLYVKDVVGKVQLQKLTTFQCQDLINKWAETLAYSTVRKIYELLNASLKYAENSDLLAKNPMRLVTMPREASFNKKTKDIEIPSEEDVRKIFATGEHMLPCGRSQYMQSYVKAYKIIAFTGLRIGELLALTWDKINIDTGIALIDSSISEVSNRDEQEGNKLKRIISEPKTKSGFRKIHLSKTVLETIKELRDLYEMQGFNAKGSLILNSKGKPASYHDVERTLRTICKNSGVKPISLHVLRHFFASRCVADGADMIALSKHLGHSRSSITLNVYSHIMDKQQNEFNKLLEGL